MRLGRDCCTRRQESCLDAASRCRSCMLTCCARHRTSPMPRPCSPRYGLQLVRVDDGAPDPRQLLGRARSRRHRQHGACARRHARAFAAARSRPPDRAAARTSRRGAHRRHRFDRRRRRGLHPAGVARRRTARRRPRARAGRHGCVGLYASASDRPPPISNATPTAPGTGWRRAAWSMRRHALCTRLRGQPGQRGFAFPDRDLLQRNSLQCLAPQTNAAKRPDKPGSAGSSPAFVTCACIGTATSLPAPRPTRPSAFRRTACDPYRHALLALAVVASLSLSALQAHALARRAGTRRQRRRPGRPEEGDRRPVRRARQRRIQGDVPGTDRGAVAVVDLHQRRQPAAVVEVERALPGAAQVAGSSSPSASTARSCRPRPRARSCC